LKKIKKNIKKKVSVLEKQIKDLIDEKSFLKEINDALKGNQEGWQEKIKQAEKLAADDSKDKRIVELEEQLRDLMFFIEAKQKIENVQEDLKDGQLVVVPSPNHSTKNKSNSKKKK